MSNASDRGKGATQELGGKIQQSVGKLIGNEEMQAKGLLKQAEGQARQTTAKAGEVVTGKVEEIVGAIKGSVGEAIGNHQMQIEGKAEELLGEARQKANKD